MVRTDNYMKYAHTNRAFRRLLFEYNTFLVISDMINAKVGTITSDESRFISWKKEDKEYFDTVKANIAKLKHEVEESKIKLAELKKAYLEEKKRNELEAKNNPEVVEEKPQVTT